MKIIDLINKISKREEVPKLIKYDNKIMYYSTAKEDYYGYYSNGNGNWLFQYLFDKCRNTNYFINDCIEILENNVIEIKVMKSSGECYWYKDYIGEKFKVEVDNSSFKIIGEERWIDFEDAIVVDEKIEEKEIKELEWWEVNGAGDEDDKFYLNVNDKEHYLCENYDDVEMTIILKINELVRAVNKLKSGENE